MVQTFIKKPIVIEALKWDGTNIEEIDNFINGFCKFDKVIGGDEKGNGHPQAYLILTISTLEGDMKADIGDWIIKGVKGEFYPCKPDIFKQSYDEV